VGVNRASFRNSFEYRQQACTTPDLTDALLQVGAAKEWQICPKHHKWSKKTGDWIKDYFTVEGTGVNVYSTYSAA
jgi:hypothetical protein